ncbi:MAG TPA: hypothetical protein VL527_06095 [Dongiaceae bacterium]|nr:hypothetical protein [Dongiaceae bacterium]
MNTDCELVQSVIEILRQGEILLAEIPDESYTRKVVIAFNASIGGHCRHCLDHFNTLCEAAAAGNLNCDHRECGTLNATRELRVGFEKLNPEFLARHLMWNDVKDETGHKS